MPTTSSPKRLAFAAALLAGALGLQACETTSGPEGGVRIDNQNNVSPTLNTVRVIDSSLARYLDVRGTRVSSVLDVEGVFVGQTPTGFRKVTVQIRNKTKYAIPLEVRASWYDASGMPSDPAQSWSRYFVQPQSMVTFEQSSTRLNSAQYYVEVRGAQ